ncbi:MAG TPA: response regulator [Candidatus Krumholzibacteria bacterium]|jgi:FixJ family two-component response regulator|nr:response regulator [Candidatus Krumholzibacteria bacterium]
MSDRPIIVVIDGDTSIRRALTRLLRTAQMGVETYASSEEFLLRLDGRDPDCLVLDSDMPGITGTELRDRLAEMGHPIPVVCITATNGVDLTRRTTGPEVLHKPFNDKTLLDAIGRAIGKREAK